MQVQTHSPLHSRMTPPSTALQNNRGPRRKRREQPRTHHTLAKSVHPPALPRRTTTPHTFPAPQPHSTARPASGGRGCPPRHPPRRPRRPALPPTCGHLLEPERPPRRAGWPPQCRRRDPSPAACRRRWPARQNRPPTTGGGRSVGEGPAHGPPTAA
ncbi:hypothetical protein I4F81_001342 [Pyropia yezoensis]|uniref:Uncharacterized protein n=1 Tax=Pyropia yezoensis TaxID=2788 RepID=A0ACC3BLV7_PYRYE|nr:hypothetical protein I4F81_001342 [Neopyropia yezoensis]